MFTALIEHKSRKEWIFAVTAAFLPLLVQLTWLLHNNQLPTADADEQLSASYHIYQHLAKHEWIKFICELYKARNYEWRPTGFYLLQVPFQVLSGGDLMFTTRATTLFCTFVTCIYIYRLLRLMLDPGQAIPGTIMLGLLPCVQWPATMLGYTESGFLPAILAVIYHFIRSDNLENKRHRIYFVMAVVTAFAIRPVEALFHLALLFVIFLGMSWHEKRISPETVYRIALGALASASILIISGIVNYKIELHLPLLKDPAQAKFFTGTAIAVIAATLALWAAGDLKQLYSRQRASNRSSAIASSFITIYTLVVLFYFPFVPKLVEWIYMCSFGSLATLRGPKPPVYTLITGFIENTGAVPFLSITALGIMSFCFFLNKEQRTALLNHRLFYLFSLIPVTLLMALHSVQYEQRKVTVVISIFLLALLIPALMSGRFWRTRNAMLMLVAAAQLYGTMLIASDKPHEKWLFAFTGGDYPVMFPFSPNPNMVMFDFIESVARRNSYKAILLPIPTVGIIDIDPFLISLLVGNMDNGIHADYPYQPSYDSETLPKFLKSGADAFLLVKDAEGEFVQSPREAVRLQALSAAARDPNDKLMLDLQALYATDKLKESGTAKKDCIHIDALRRETCVFELLKEPLKK